MVPHGAVLGIEIGGTKLQFGVGHGLEPDLVALERYDVDRRAGAAGILKTIQEVAPRLIQQYQVQRVGIGFGGPVQHGRVIRSHQVEGWQNWPLAAWCQEKLGRPAVVGNDCDVAALAEAHWGAGRGQDPVFYVTVGTGVGGGLVVNGQLYGEGRPAVAEIGHLRPIVPSADEDAVTVQTTVESRASGLGIVQTLNALAGLTKDALANPTCHGVSDEKWQRDLQHIRDMMADRQARRTELTARDVARLAQQGNRLAQTALDTAIATLGWAIAQVITLLAPQVVVVGGGVAQMGETLFFEPLRRAVDRYVFPPLREHYQIRPAALGEQVVVIGAVLLAAQRVPA